MDLCKSGNRQRRGECPGIELQGRSLEFAEKVCYIGDTVGFRGGAIDSLLARRMDGIILGIYYLR